MCQLKVKAIEFLFKLGDVKVGFLNDSTKNGEIRSTYRIIFVLNKPQMLNFINLGIMCF